jgi:hypothetical protein
MKQNRILMATLMAFAVVVPVRQAWAETTTLICDSIEFPRADPTILDLDAAQNSVTMQGAVVSAVAIDPRTIAFHASAQIQADYSIDRLTGKMSAKISVPNDPRIALWHYNCHAAKPQF